MDSAGQPKHIQPSPLPNPAMPWLAAQMARASVSMVRYHGQPIPGHGQPKPIQGGHRPCVAHVNSSPWPGSQFSPWLLQPWPTSPCPSRRQPSLLTTQTAQPTQHPAQLMAGPKPLQAQPMSGQNHCRLSPRPSKPMAGAANGQSRPWTIQPIAD
jgi:hypothetical protein